MPDEEAALQQQLQSMTPEQIQELQKKACIFCQIAQEKIPAKTIFQDEICIAILDIHPAAPGHIILMPKEHYSFLDETPDKTIAHCFKVAKQLSQVALRALKVQGTSIIFPIGEAAGQKAPHLMMHLIPRLEGDDLELKLPLHDLENEQEVISTIKRTLEETEKGTTEKEAKFEERKEASKEIEKETEMGFDGEKEVSEKEEEQLEETGEEIEEEESGKEIGGEKTVRQPERPQDEFQFLQTLFDGKKPDVEEFNLNEAFEQGEPEENFVTEEKKEKETIMPEEKYQENILEEEKAINEAPEEISFDFQEEKEHLNEEKSSETKKEKIRKENREKEKRTPSKEKKSEKKTKKTSKSKGYEDNLEDQLDRVAELLRGG